MNDIHVFTGRAFSPRLYIRGIPWKIMVEPRQDGNNKKYFAFFVVCSIDSESFSWSCQASAELRILPHKPHTKSYTRKVEHLFSNEEADWGFQHYISWAELVKQSKGYVKDNCITLEVNVKADGPKFGRKCEVPTEITTLMNIHIVLDEDLRKHHSFDLFDPKSTKPRNYNVNGLCTVNEFLDILSGTLKCTLDKLRIWPFAWRTNQTFRPICRDRDSKTIETIQEAAFYENPWTVYVEMLDPTSSATKLPTFNNMSDVLLFLKMYDPKTKTILYCGHIYMPMSSKIGEFLLPVVCKRAGFPPNTQILLFEEVRAHQVEAISSFDKPLEDVVDDLMDGDIFIFQEKDLQLNSYDVPTAKEYYKMLKTTKKK